MPTVRYTLDPKKPPRMTKTEKARFDAIKDEDINYSDIPELGDEFFKQAKLATEFKKSKTRITIRLDSDVLDWLQDMGEGYQTRANMILRAAMEHQKHS